MANITIKLSQAALDSQISVGAIAGEAGGTINGALDSALSISNIIDDNYNYPKSVNASNNQAIYTFYDGASIKINGSLDNPGLGYGSATINKYTYSKPGTSLLEITGNNRAYFYSSGGYETYDGTVNSFKISVLNDSLSLLGKQTSIINGQIKFNSGDDLSGKITSITTTSSKILKSGEILGNFTIKSGNATTPYGYYENSVIDRYSNVSGTLNKYSTKYYDGSIISADFSSAPLTIENDEVVDFYQLSDPKNLPGNDKLDISLPNNIYGDFIIRTGAGNDNITLAGGGESLHLDTGSGNDTVVIKSGNHQIQTGSGNDTITGGNGVETLVYAGKRSDHVIQKLANGKLTIKSTEKTDTAYKVEWLEFSDSKIAVTSLPVKNVAPTGNVTITGPATQGQKLTASNKLADADGLGKIGYQWLADGVVIKGATASTFALTQTEVGKTISVKASYTDKLGTAEGVTSSATAMIASPSKTGTPGKDVLGGSTGHDLLSGQAGNDVIYGGLGNDTLVGGAGSDRLTGGAGSDRFKFEALTDLGLGATARDVITNFKRGEGDKIDLSAIDTNSALKDDQDFAWVTKFGTTAGQVRFAADGQGNGIVYLNTDKDVSAEYEIMLTGVTTLAATDLVL